MDHHLIRLDDLAPPLETWKVLVKVDKGARMLLRVFDDQMIDRFSNMLKEKRTYMIQFFRVAMGAVKLSMTISISCLCLAPFFFYANHHSSCLICWFRFRLCRHIFSLYFNFIKDFCGLLVSIGDLDFFRVQGMHTRKPEFVVQDIERNKVTCVLFGNSAEKAFTEYQPVSSMRKLVVVVQYARIKR